MISEAVVAVAVVIRLVEHGCDVDIAVCRRQKHLIIEKRVGNE